MKRKNRENRLVNGVERKEYRAWLSMRSRCLFPSHKSYQDYGGRGIKICDRWIEDFNAFFIDMGEKPTPKHTLDRIDTNGNYEKSNCRWATQKEQCRNRRSNTWIEYNGITMTKTEWANELGVNKNNLLWNKKRTPAETIHHYKTKGVRQFRFYEKNGERLSTADWAKRFNIKRTTLSAYIRYNSFEKAYTHYTKNIENENNNRII